MQGILMYTLMIHFVYISNVWLPVTGTQSLDSLYSKKKERERVSTAFSLGVKFCNNWNFDLNFVLGEKAYYFNFILNTLF